jgi:hypothetical protein
MADLYAAAWQMYRAMPELCSADVLAGAFLHAAANRWLVPDLAPVGIPADEPHAVEKVRARHLFLTLTREQDIPKAALLSVLEAVPSRWHRYTGTMSLLRQLGRLQLNDAERDRYAALCIRAHTAQESE